MRILGWGGLFLVVGLIIAVGLFWSRLGSREVIIAPLSPILSVPEATSSGLAVPAAPKKRVDIENQKPLADPPAEIKAIYSTSWSAASPKKIVYFIDLIKKTELNAIVIDIKAFDGYVAYDIKNAEAEKYGAKEIRIPLINTLIKRLHNEGIYVIARQTIFQDPLLAKARPDWAIHSRAKLPAKFSSSTARDWRWASSTLWRDRKGLSWIDPAAQAAWDYNIAIAKDAASRGFDEINFDYIRFPSDGDLNDTQYLFWDEKKDQKEVLREFFEHLRRETDGIKISADIFGLATVERTTDLGIGQHLETLVDYFDFISPMVYPSHYAHGFIGYKNPAAFPYEVVKYSMENALERLKNYDLGFKNGSATSEISDPEIQKAKSYKLKAKLRPWLQDFDLGADYDVAKVRQEIKAVYDAASSTPELINGWMLWNPSNVYSITNN